MSWRAWTAGVHFDSKGVKAVGFFLGRWALVGVALLALATTAEATESLAAAAAPVPLVSRPQAHVADRTVRSELARLRHRRAITELAYRRYVHSFNAALSAERGLGGTRALELEAVIENLHGIAADGQLSASRLPALFLTLDRNREWWTTGPLLGSGQRVGFPRSQLVWEYYPGQGIELQQLGSWGQADWMYQAGPKYWPRLRNLVDELVPLAAHRAGGFAWEYYFTFGGGTPPWTSAMSQGTAIQALTQTYEATHDKTYLQLARRSLPVLAAPPPTGVSVRTRRGLRYLLYSFDPAPADAVINGFLQTLIGVFDYATVSHDPTGWRLFRAGDAEARAELPSYDTGTWSLYQPGQEDSVDYHELVTGFLQQLCTRTRATIYCRTAARFKADLARRQQSHAAASEGGSSGVLPAPDLELGVP